MVTVHWPEVLQVFVQGQSETLVEAQTVRDISEKLPSEIARRVLDANGDLRRFIIIYVNEVDARHLQGLDTPLRAGDEVAIVPAICNLLWEVVERDLFNCC